MRNRPIFITVKNYVDSQGYTIQQIKNVTALQVKNLLSLTDEQFSQYSLYTGGIKKLLIQDLQDDIDVQTLTDLKAQVNTWLLARFPDYEVEKDFEDKANRKIVFYLDGRNV